MMNFTLIGSLPLLARIKAFHGFDFHPELAFVVDGAARINILVAFGGLKRRSEPFVQRIGRLHVIVARNTGPFGLPGACSQSP